MGNKNVKFPSEIDLVKAAQHEYDFLRMTDAHPALYKEPVIRNAIYRYEQYWLPLVAEYEGQFLPAPLDIEWVWHCHILNPFQYRHDCEKIVNKVVDHRPYKVCEANRPQSERYWKDKYENIPFDIDLNNDAPSLIDPSYIQQSLYDIASATLRQRSFNYGSSLPHYRDRKFLKKAVWRYFIMLEIKKEHPRTFIVPCYDNDLIWHTHQQHPLAYQQDTSSILGKMLDHNDTTSDRSPGSELENGSAATKRLWKQKGHKFAVPGAMYRGEPPMPQPKQDPYWFISLKHKVSFAVFLNGFRLTVFLIYFCHFFFYARCLVFLTSYQSQESRDTF